MEWPFDDLIKILKGEEAEEDDNFVEGKEECEKVVGSGKIDFGGVTGSIRSIGVME